MSRNQNWSSLRQNNSKSNWQVSNILDLQHVHRFKFNPYLPVGHRYHGIDYEYVNMLRIQNVWNSSDGKSSSTLRKYFKPLARLIMRCCKSSKHKLQNLHKINRSNNSSALVLSTNLSFHKKGDKMSFEWKSCFLLFPTSIIFLLLTVTCQTFFLIFRPDFIRTVT